MATMLAPPAETKPSPPRRPFDVSRYVAQEMDRLFNEFGVRTHWPFVPLADRDEGIWMPELEVEEKDGIFRVRVDLPGMKKEDVKVDLAEGLLTVKGERTRETERKEKDYFRSERSYGRFVRTVTLPEGAKLDTAKATFADGVLDITMTITPDVPAARRLVIG